MHLVRNIIQLALLCSRFNAVLDSLHIGIKQGDSSNKVVSYFDDADYKKKWLRTGRIFC